MTQVAAVLALLLLAGCATTHSLTPVALESTPAVQSHRDPSLKPSAYATFSVFPLSKVNPQASLQDASLKKPMLFMLRNAMESRGYQYVHLNETPDLLVTLDASTTGGLKKPPRTLLPPDLTPGGMIPQPQAVASLLNDDSAAYGWGTLNNLSFSSLEPLPEYPPRPGSPPAPKANGYTFTTLTISVIDPTTFTEVWAGAGAGISRTPDLRINSQLVLWAVIHQFPLASTPELLTSPASISGLEMEIFTNDGTHYFPAVTAVGKGSSAWRSGLKRWDMIIAAKAETVAGQSYAKFRENFGGPVNSSLSMIVWRNGEQVHVSVPREQATLSSDMVSSSPRAAKTPSYLWIPRTKVNSRYTVPAFGAVILATLVVVAATGGITL